MYNISVVCKHAEQVEMIVYMGYGARKRLERHPFLRMPFSIGFRDVRPPIATGSGLNEDEFSRSETELTTTNWLSL